MTLNPLPWIKAHPVETGIIVVALLAIWYFLGAGKAQTNGGGGDGSAAAYYAAQSAQAQSGNALAAVQLETAAATAQDQINANASVTNNQNWANADVEQVKSNNAAAQAIAGLQSKTEIAIAPYQAQQSLFQVLGLVASQPGSTVSQSDSGFFGLGASSSTSYVPNPSAVMASGELSHLVSTGL